MLIQGDALVAKLRTQQAAVMEVRWNHGGPRGEVPIADAIRLAASGSYVGVGNQKRIHYLRPVTTIYPIRAGSSFTRRLDDGFGRKVAPPWVVEHGSRGNSWIKPIPSKIAVVRNVGC